MKKAALLVLLFAFTGCSVTNQATSVLFPARYDTNEYELINWIRTTAELSVDSCYSTDISRENFKVLHKGSLEFKNFTQYLRRNQPTHDLAINLHLLVDEGYTLYDNQEVSQFFCQTSLLQIADSATSIQQVIGRKRR